jgi:hypothetical protein
MGFSHPGNAIQGPLVRAGDPVRVDAVKPPPPPFGEFICMPLLFDSLWLPPLLLSGQPYDTDPGAAVATSFGTLIAPP